MGCTRCSIQDFEARGRRLEVEFRDPAGSAPLWDFRYADALIQWMPPEMPPVETMQLHCWVSQAPCRGYHDGQPPKGGLANRAADLHQPPALQPAPSSGSVGLTRNTHDAEPHPVGTVDLDAPASGG